MKEDKKDYAQPLIMWFHENKREMPWRKTKDPYKIWVSEIMLQQTQVATVIPYYLRFIERFPTVKDLALAHLEEVHRYWQGLGYYRRGENLWKGAKVIQEKWQGKFPLRPEEIKEIPGIGPYTLGAVCSIAYGLPLPAVDGNVMRVISRWYRISEDIGCAKYRRLFEAKVLEQMPEDSGSFNQALMELGALICTPKNPKCQECPVKMLCEAHQYHIEEEFPVKLKKVKPIEEEYQVVLIDKEGKLGMIKRPAQGLLANLWGLPMLTTQQWEEGGWESYPYIELEKITHIFTHRKWKMFPKILKWSKEREEKWNSQEETLREIQYFTEEELRKLPIGTAFKKVLKQAKIQG